ncbi:MAG: GNAT family N-acetyltransferase [Lachnospiraceae bacterium]|nr:GNAT family N-acetyltransferase [Lachnospiraceae bacterium]
MDLIQVTENLIPAFKPLLTKTALADLMNDPDTVAVGAVDDDNKACGIMLMHVAESFCMITHLAVADSARRKGIAGMLVDKAELSSERMYIVLIAILCPESEEDDLYQFFSNRPEWVVEHRSDDENGDYYLAAWDRP